MEFKPVKAFLILLATLTPIVGACLIGSATDWRVGLGAWILTQVSARVTTDD